MKRMVSFDELVREIAVALAESDEDFVVGIANQVLVGDTVCEGDSLFSRNDEPEQAVD